MNLSFSDAQTKCLALMAEKLTILQELLRVTKLEDFENPEVDTEHKVVRYGILFEKREPMLEHIKKIDEQLQSATYREVLGSSTQQFIREYELQNAQIKQIVTNIIDIDKKNIAYSEGLMRKVKEGMKEIQTGKTIHALYHDEPQTTDGVFFDKKN